MANTNYILEKDNCIICLMDEEESSKLTNNDKCPCRYSYHNECMKNITTCPYCKIPFSTITLPTGPVEQVYETNISSIDSCCLKAVFFTIIIAGLSVIGYFTAILS